MQDQKGDQYFESILFEFGRLGIGHGPFTRVFKLDAMIGTPDHCPVKKSVSHSDKILMTTAIECPICESANVKSLYRMKGADIVECEQCTMVFVPTVAPEVTAIYKHDYYNNTDGTKGYSNYRSELTSHLLTFGRYLEEAQFRLGRIGRLLDVGCALGHMGEAARRKKWDVYVTDVSEFAVIEARKNFGLNGFVSGTEKLPVKAGSFDLISMYDVIEHLSHPKELLSGVKKALSPDGLLHLTTPNIASLSSKLMGRSWYHIKPEEHLLYFSPETLRLFLENCGFEVVRIKPVSTVMRVSDIFLRLERYWKLGAKLGRSILKAFGLGNLRLRIYVGEMQAWVKPGGGASKKNLTPVKDILDIVCCPKCSSEIQLFEETEAICTQCEQSFEVQEGVINFSRYAKRSKQKVIGSS